MTAVVTLKPGERGRHYRLPTDADFAGSAIGAEASGESVGRVGAQRAAGSLSGAR